MLRTALTDLLGIEVPILQSGMRRVAGPELVAEVSRAGGLGILAGLALGAAELRKQIRHLRTLTDRRGDGEHFPLLSGQSLGLIHDLPGAAEVVTQLVEEARAAMAKLPGDLG